MKRTLIVIAAAAVLVLAVSGTAFAENHSGQQRLGGEVPFTVDASGNLTSGGEAAMVNGVSVPGAGTNTYADWNTALGTNSSSGSPHGNYTTSTVKCVVCHSVHYAAPGGAPVTSGLQSADTLLRMQAGQACVYCHATAGVGVNGTPVYDGRGAAGLAQTGGAADTGHYTGTNCSECHTSVHGGNADDSVASLDGFLLKKIPQASVAGTTAPTSNMIEAITAIDHVAVNQGFAPGDALAGTIGDYASTNSLTLREQAVGVFCAECHNGAYDTGAAGASTNVLGSGLAAFSGHRIAATATVDWNADHSKSSGALSNATIAWAPAANCKACHDATDRFGNVAFPHSWGGTKMWLMSAPDANTAGKTALPYGTDPNSGFDQNAPQLSDGVCLKCHVASGGSAGVGVTY